LSNRRLGLLLALYVVVALGYAYFATISWKYWPGFREPRISLYIAVYSGRILLGAAFGAALVYGTGKRGLGERPTTSTRRSVTRIVLLSASIGLAVLVGVVPLYLIMKWAPLLSYLYRPETQAIAWLWLGALLADILLPRR